MPGDDRVQTSGRLRSDHAPLGNCPAADWTAGTLPILVNNAPEQRWAREQKSTFRVPDDPSGDSQRKNWQPHKRRCTTFNKVLRDRGARTHKLAVLLRDRDLQDRKST